MHDFEKWSDKEILQQLDNPISGGPRPSLLAHELVRRALAFRAEAIEELKRHAESAMREIRNPMARDLYEVMAVALGKALTIVKGES